MNWIADCALDTDILWNIRKGIGEHFQVEITSQGLRNFICVDKKLSDVGCDLCEGSTEGTVGFH